MPGYVPNQCASIVDLCHKKEDFCPKNPEEDPACKLPDLYRVWKRRRDDAIKPGCWDDPQVCLYHPWDAKSPYLEQEELSMIFRSNVFPGYTYTGTRFSSYDAFFNANVFKRRGESSIPEKFRKRNTDFTTWIQKMIQDKVLMKQKMTTGLQQKSQSLAKSALDLPAKINYHKKNNLTLADKKSALFEKPNLDKSKEKTNVETLVVGDLEKSNIATTSILKQNPANTSFIKPDIEKQNLSNTSVIKPDIEKQNPANTSVIKPDIEKQNLSNTSVIKPDIEKKNLSNTSVIKPDIEKQNLSKTSITKPDIEKQNLPKTSVTKPDIEIPNPVKSTLDASTLEKSTTEKSSEKVILKKSADIKAPRESNVVKIMSEKY